jgi:hypothetical protein
MPDLFPVWINPLMIKMPFFLTALGMVACLSAAPLTTRSLADAPPAVSASPATSTSLPALTPDRPGFTNGAEVVLPSRTQVEGGIAQTTAESRTGGGATTDYPELLIRRGLTPQVELRVGLPDYSAVVGGGHGLGDGSIGVKYKFYQSRDGSTKAALIPAVTVPVGARGFTSGHADPLLTLAAQTASGPRWGIAANLAFSDPSQSGGRIVTAAPSASVSYQMTPSLAGYGELYDSFAHRSGPIPVADGGFTFLVNSNLQVDAEAGYGLGASAPTRFFGGGISVRF